MRMTVAVCLSQWQSSITRWCGWWLSKTSLPPTRSILVYVWSFIFSTSAFYRSCVSFQFIGPVTGRCGHVITSHPFWQCLPAAVVIITHTLWNTLDVIMGTTGAGRPAATATVYCVQWRTVTLILSQGVGSERKKYRETYERNKVLDQLYWLNDILDQLFRYLYAHIYKTSYPKLIRSGSDLRVLSGCVIVWGWACVWSSTMMRSEEEELNKLRWSDASLTTNCGAIKKCINNQTIKCIRECITL